MSKHLDERQLTSYVYRTLTDTQRETMDIHIGTCQACRVRLAEHQALHRRARYSIMDRRREGSRFSQATFAEIAPRLRRSRRMAMFWTGSKQFVLGAATLAVLVVLVVGLVAFFGGIGQSLPVAPGPRPQKIEPSATPMTNVLPPGTYTIIITEEDLAANNMHSADDRYIFLGEWQTAFDPDGHYIIKRTSPDRSSHMVIDEGQYALSADQLTFTGVEMTSACMDSSGVQIGSYRWALDGGALTLTAIEDRCSERNFSLTVHPWSKVELPSGTYVTTITQEDSSKSSIIGTWELTLAEDNHWSATYLGSVVAEGRYTLTPDQIVFTHEKGPYTRTCTNIGAETGTYGWAFDGKMLTLTTIEDECADRNDVWTAHPWSKVELPSGTYVTTITQEDFLSRDDLDLSARTILLGEWEMTLTEGSRYSHDEVTEGGRLVVAEEGHYTLTRDQIVFTAEGGAYACTDPKEVKVGTYQWALDGKTLTLTTVEDPCPERNTLNSAHPWTKQD